MAKKEEITYAEAMAKIELTLAKLRNDELDVDTLSAEVKQATELIALCKKKLHKTETEIAKILE